MELNELLKSCKSIHPREGFSTRSLPTILAMQPYPAKKPFSIFQFAFENVQYGFAIALTGFLLIVFFGASPLMRFLTPLRLSSLDPVGLRAEAQEVDIQIQLINVDYPENASSIFLGVETTTQKTVGSQTPKAQPTARTKITPIEPPSLTSTEEITLDEALDILSN